MEEDRRRRREGAVEVGFGREIVPVSGLVRLLGAAEPHQPAADAPPAECFGGAAVQGQDAFFQRLPGPAALLAHDGADLVHRFAFTGMTAESAAGGLAAGALAEDAVLALAVLCDGIRHESLPGRVRKRPPPSGKGIAFSREAATTYGQDRTELGGSHGKAGEPEHDHCRLVGTGKAFHRPLLLLTAGSGCSTWTAASPLLSGWKAGVSGSGPSRVSYSLPRDGCPRSALASLTVR